MSICYLLDEIEGSLLEILEIIVLPSNLFEVLQRRSHIVLRPIN